MEKTILLFEKGLPLPHYGGSGVTHPDIHYYPERKLGYRFWLYYTPYPDEKVEEICLVHGNEPHHLIDLWIKNPIISKNESELIIADPDIHYDGKRYVMLYTSCIGTKKENKDGKTLVIKRATSHNGLIWKIQDNPILKNHKNLLEPTAIHYEDKLYTICNQDNQILKVFTGNRELYTMPRIKENYFLNHPHLSIRPDGDLQLYVLAKSIYEKSYIKLFKLIGNDIESLKVKEELKFKDDYYMPYRASSTEMDGKELLYVSFCLTPSSGRDVEEARLNRQPRHMINYLVREYG
jgi:hypothetical protein